MPQFVILTHDHPVLHWDLLLEQKESLRSWRIMKEPALDQAIEACPLPDHRKMYLDYEGPVSQNRGTVKQWDKGEYQILSEQDSVLQFQLIGNKLNGVARIIQENDKQYFQLNSR